MTDQSVPWPENHYHAYLVRLWQDRPENPWRVVVRDCDSQKERRFNTVEELFLFLHRQTEGRGTDRTEEIRS